MTIVRKAENESPLPFHDTSVRVRYAETDQMGVVYHANYLIWMEIGRVELMRSLGVEYKEMEAQDDCHIVVVDVHCRYLRSARYDEVLRIHTIISEARSRAAAVLLALCELLWMSWAAITARRPSLMAPGWP